MQFVIQHGTHRSTDESGCMKFRNWTQTKGALRVLGPQPRTRSTASPTQKHLPPPLWTPSSHALDWRRSDTVNNNDANSDCTTPWGSATIAIDPRRSGSRPPHCGPNRDHRQASPGTPKTRTSTKYMDYRNHSFTLKSLNPEPRV